MSKVNREPASPGLHIAMFGRFRVEIDGVPLKPHRPTDLRALAYLLLHHDSSIDRLAVAARWKNEGPDLWGTEARAYLICAVSDPVIRRGRFVTQITAGSSQVGYHENG